MIFSLKYFSSKIKFWYNSPKYSLLYVYDSSIIVSLSDELSFKIDVCILNWKGRNYRFSCFNLSKEINPTDSYVKQTNSGLIIYLAKANTSDFWDSLEKKKLIA